MIGFTFQFCLAAMLVLGAQSARGEKLVTRAETEFDVVTNTALIASANNYLQRFINMSANSEHRRLAEDFLQSLYSSYATKCDYRDDGDGRALLCKIVTKRTIRNISVKNLPASLLEGELKRRISIEIGQTIDIDESIKDLLSLVKGRVETYLRKNGYYDATVAVSHQAPPKEPWADITIEITGGVFARVNSVVVSGDSPVSPSSVKKLFSRMCFSFNRIIESVSIGTVGCYSRELERESVQNLQDRLAKMGYVQSQIRVSHYWINPSDETAPVICRSHDAKLPQYRCVNMRVHVDSGPRFRWTVNVKDRLSISRNALTRFIASIFSVDQLSRASTSDQSDEIPLDYLILEEELANQVTFVAAKNVDEQELTASADEITEFLVAHGYANAEVVPSLVQEDDENVVVTFDVYADRPFFLESVKVSPEKYAAFFDEEALDSLVKLRSFTANGSPSYPAINAAKEEVASRLKARGWKDVTVVADMETTDNGAVNLVFYVTSDKRELIDEVIIFNGLERLNEDILPNLHNCDNFMPLKRGLAVQRRCAKSSFVPERVNDDSLKIADHYQANGYLYAEVASEIVQVEDRHKIVFTVFDSRYDEKSLKPLVAQSINDIIISGNTKTAAGAIKRLFPKDGKNNTLDPFSIKLGLSRLREAGRFSRIDHKIMFGEENSDDAYFLLQVAERPSLSLDTSVAFSTDQLFSFEAELEEANLFRSMLKLNTSLALGMFWGRQSIISNKLVWPYMFGQPLRLTVTAPYIVFDDWLHRAEQSRRLQSKIFLRLDWRLNSRVLPYLEYWLVFTQEDRNATVLGASEMFSSLDGLIPTIKTRGEIQGVLKPGISFVSLDNPFDPQSGFDINVWTELSGGPLLGDPPFVNLGAQNRFFVPLGPLTLALQATFMRAFIEPNEENFRKLRNVSVMDQLGGDRSVRGFKTFAIGMTHFDGALTKYAGYVSNVANVELRFPLTSKSAIGNFSGALFVDEGMVIPCGSLFRCVDKASVKSLASRYAFGLSVGVALRYSLPVGPISLDYGISPLTGDNRVHLLFGYSF